MLKKPLVTAVLGVALAGAFGSAQAANIAAYVITDTPLAFEVTWTGNLVSDLFDAPTLPQSSNWVVSGPVVTYPAKPAPLPTLFVASIEAYHKADPHPAEVGGPTFSGLVAGFNGVYVATSAMADHNAPDPATWTPPADWITPHWDHYSFSVNSDASGNATIQLKALHPVPEPETYAMLLAGLGVIGAVIRRRRSRC